MGVNKTTPSRKTYRSRSQALVIGAFLALVLGLALPRIVQDPRAGTIVLGGAIVGVMLVGGGRAVLAVLKVTSQGVMIRNPFRTTRIAWTEIAGFELGRYRLLGCVCTVRQHDGTVTPVFAIEGITGSRAGR